MWSWSLEKHVAIHLKWSTFRPPLWHSLTVSTKWSVLVINYLNGKCVNNLLKRFYWIIIPDYAFLNHFHHHKELLSDYHNSSGPEALSLCNPSLATNKIGDDQQLKRRRGDARAAPMTRNWSSTNNQRVLYKHWRKCYLDWTINRINNHLMTTLIVSGYLFYVTTGIYYKDGIDSTYSAATVQWSPKCSEYYELIQISRGIH